MKHLKGFKFSLPLFILAVLLHHPISARAITLGLIGNYPARDIKLFLSLARYLSQELRDEGVTEGKVLVAQDIAELAAFLRKAKSIFISIATSAGSPSIASWEAAPCCAAGRRVSPNITV